MNIENPKVSVRLMTYNHSNTIKQAVESVLEQKTTFKVELLIGDDFSTDGNLDQIKNLTSTDNIEIKILNRPINGAYQIERQKKGRLYNFQNIIENCSGEYIALLDGDDYWTDPLKLQKQVDFLDKNSDCVICFHRVSVLENNQLHQDVIDEKVKIMQKKVMSRIDLLQYGNFIHTPSVLFRNQNISFPPEFLKSTVGDYFLYIILSEFGNIQQIDEDMAVYRKGSGIFSTLDELKLQQSILKYHSCILSYLKDEKEKQIVLDRMYKKIDLFYELSQHNRNDLIKLIKQKIKALIK